MTTFNQFPPSTLKLPAELIHIIVAPFQGDMLTLFRLTWASKALRAIVQPILLETFSSLYLSSPGKWFRKVDKECCPEALQELFTDIWPSHAHVVEEASFDIDEYHHFGAIKTLLGQTLPKLQGLCMTHGGDDGWHYVSTDEFGTMVYPKLKSLELRQISGLPLTLLTELPSLERLYLNSCSFPEPYSDDEDDRGNCSCQSDPCSCDRPPPLAPAVPHPLQELVIEDAYDTDDIGHLLSSVRLHGCQLNSFRLSNLSRPEFMGIDLDYVPSIIPMLTPIEHTIHTLDLGLTIFKYSLHFLANETPNAFFTKLSPFRLDKFTSLQVFQNSVVVNGRNPRMKTATLLFDWLAIQISLLPKHIAYSVLLDVFEKDYYYKPPLWDWDGQNPPISTNWSSLESAVLRRKDENLSFQWHVRIGKKKEVVMGHVVQSIRESFGTCLSHGLMTMHFGKPPYE
ncbi:hypothetical protein DL96DRAFT_1810285 [Flagelloscypha sp. PMI_526]|nr:hypothetical protein DL96DRAFT_1810285 [Flagelloscypha sp. PMI_526]